MTIQEHLHKYPSKVYNGTKYDPKTAELLQYVCQNTRYSMLFCRADGELFIVECEGPESERGPGFIIFFMGDDLTKKKLLPFDADCISPQSLKFHGIS